MITKLLLKIRFKKKSLPHHSFFIYNYRTFYSWNSYLAQTTTRSLSKVNLKGFYLQKIKINRFPTKNRLPSEGKEGNRAFVQITCVQVKYDGQKSPQNGNAIGKY